jgi:hypothetical protein
MKSTHATEAFMKQDRFLMGILIGIGVLIIAALALFFVRKDTQTYISDDVPEGVVHNYIVAILNKDYEKAYSYLADLEHKPTFDEFRNSFVTGMLSPQNSAVDVGESDITGDDAYVDVAMIYNPSDPFSTGYRDIQRAILVKQGGVWKLSSMPTYYLWDYNWYQEQIK